MEQDVAVETLVPGDILVLNAGDLVPADCRLLAARDLDVEEAVLTGESFPVSKTVAAAPVDARLAERPGALFQGTHVVSGTATAVGVDTGTRTVLAELSRGLERRRPETEFEHGVSRFGYLLLEITAVLVVVVFATNVALDRAVLDALLFTLALAVGLTPQLLPAIVSVTLARGARRMASQDVIVRRLVAIEDFGADRYGSGWSPQPPRSPPQPSTEAFSCLAPRIHASRPARSAPKQHGVPLRDPPSGADGLPSGDSRRDGHSRRQSARSTMLDSAYRRQASTRRSAA